MTAPTKSARPAKVHPVANPEKRMQVRPATIACLGVAIILLIVAGIYIAETADALPGFFPGHEAGSSAHHVKHAIAFVGLAVLAVIGAWFTSAPTPA